MPFVVAVEDVSVMFSETNLELQTFFGFVYFFDITCRSGTIATYINETFC